VHSSERTPEMFHGYVCDVTATTTAGMVPILCAEVCGRRALPGAEGLSAGVVFESAVCIVAIGAARVLARRRAVLRDRILSTEIFWI
jgi:hypothetical protein